MTAHDPRVTLTEAEIERLCDALEDSDAEYRVEQRVAREVEHLIAARLAPIRALADEWETEGAELVRYCHSGRDVFEGETQLRAARALRAALEAPVSVVLTCRCPPCPGRGNDGHGMTHCAECCFGTRVDAELDCPTHGDPRYPTAEEQA